MILYNKEGEIVGEIYEEQPQPEQPEHKIATTEEKLKKIFYDADEKDVEDFYETLNEFARDFHVSNETQENFLLAQIVAETGRDLISKRENLNYSCDALKRTFSRYKNNPNWANRDGRCNGHPANQVNIGNIAYADRIGNGDINSGDGYRFRGGGYFQLTGRSNYRRMADVIQQVTGDAIGPEGLEREITTPRVGLLSALAFWLDNKCYQCGNIDCVTEKINKYTDSYDKRKKIYQEIAAL